MPFSPPDPKRLLGCLLAVVIPGTCAQAAFRTNGVEYAISSALAGDQVFPHLSINYSGGYVVWQDNVTDGDGWGISALRLGSTFTPQFSSFRVNSIGAGDQELPQVAVLGGGAAAFVWQGGPVGSQHIWARFLSSGGTWLGNDVLVNSATNTWQKFPVIASLAGGNVIVAWGSYNQFSANSMQDVYAQILSPSGQKVGSEFLVNQFTSYNQRTPAVAALSDGRFVIVWVSEQQTALNHVDIYGRIFSASGSPAGAEFLVNTATNVCANPSVAASVGGGFTVAWGEKDALTQSNGWDVVARGYTNGAAIGGPVTMMNTYRFGDQFAPRISALQDGFMVAWTSLGQDGSEEGVFGRFLDPSGVPTSGEFRVNTRTASRQIHPVVASDGSGNFAAVWSSFVGSSSGMDLYAQRYVSTSQPLSAPAAPFVTVLSSNALTVSWPVVAGLSVATYEIYADGSLTPTAAVANDWWTMTGLSPSSTHYFQVDYVLTDGRRSPASGYTTNTTYSVYTYGGIPADWMAYYFGPDSYLWPSPYADSDGDGATTLYEFLSGTNPTNSASVLRIKLQPSVQGLYLGWNTQPGLIYQVQTSTDLSAWANVGGPRFAAGTTDSIYVGGNRNANYRIIRLR